METGLAYRFARRTTVVIIMPSVNRLTAVTSESRPSQGVHAREKQSGKWAKGNNLKVRTLDKRSRFM